LGVIRYDAALEVLLVTKGHRFERDAFFQVFESWPDITCTSVEQPAAQRFFTPDAARAYDAFVLYDMPGIEFTRDRKMRHVDPTPEYKRGFLDLLEAGHGFVFLHHAIAGWPSWPEYAEIVGGRFHYAPATLRGVAYPDSGYRHAVRHRVRVVDPEHPVTRGLGSDFEIEDELYLCPIFEAELTPLLRSDFDFSAQHFHSAALAVEGRRDESEGWHHPHGSGLIGWAHVHGRSPIVYLACGDGPSAYANPAFSRLVENAIRWVASDEARSWALERSMA
jgi:type 1 glutamine amidotransferase